MQPLYSILPGWTSPPSIPKDPILPQGTDTPIEEGDEKYDTNVCPICFVNVRKCAFIPCGHKAACVQCSNTILLGSNKCPICREKCQGATLVRDC